MSRRGTGVDEAPSSPLGVKTQLQGPNLGSAKDQEPESDSAVSVEAARISSGVDGAQAESHMDQPTSSKNVVVDMVEGGTTYLHNPEKEEANKTLEPYFPTINCEAFAPLKICLLVRIRQGIRRQRVGTSFRENGSKAQQADVTGRWSRRSYFSAEKLIINSNFRIQPAHHCHRETHKQQLVEGTVIQPH